MSRDKQTYLKFKPFADDLRKAEVWCELDCVLNRNKTVQNLYKMGYRKSQDVAEEIFAEIEDAHEECIHIDPTTNIGYLLQTKFVHKLAELKKKYTEGGE